MRIVIYYTHRESVGHSIRMMSLAKGIKCLSRKKNEVLIVQASLPQPELEKDTPEIFNVPSPLANRKWLYAEPENIDRNIVKKRLSSITRKIYDFKPDIFITDSFPLDRLNIEGRYEIMPLITLLKNKFPKIRIYSSVGYPVFPLNPENQNLSLKYTAMYDAILVHTPPDVDLKYLYKIMNERERKRYVSFIQALSGKIKFTGYIIDKSRLRKSSLPEKNIRDFKSKRIILISRGGGFIYSGLINSCLKSAPFFKGKDILLLISAGLSTSESEMRKFRKLASYSKNVKIVKFLSDFSAYLKRCDVSVSMSGYNTGIELLWFKKNRPIVIPNTATEKFEQLYRSQILKDYLEATVIKYKDLTPQRIFKEINCRLNKKNKHNHRIPESWFNGLENTINFIRNDYAS